MEDVCISDCHSMGDGGGIEICSSFNTLERVTVYQCEAGVCGGGLYVEGGVTMRACSIRNNRAVSRAGGLYYDGYVTYSMYELSSIYNNQVLNGLQKGIDIHGIIDETECVRLDTFTVMQPDVQTLDVTGASCNAIIQHGWYTQYASDLYVSPDGETTNTGLIPDDPLPSLHQALLSCLSTSADPHTIYLLPGTYKTAENFPYYLGRSISIVGTSAQEVVLNSENRAFFMIDEESNARFENLTFCEGYSFHEVLGVLNGKVDIADCVFKSNIAGYEGVIAAYDPSEVRINRTLFYANSTPWGTTTISNFGAVYVMNNCVVANQNCNGIVQINNHYGDMCILNSIFWNNGVTQITNSGNVTIDYSLIEGGENALHTCSSGITYYMDGNIDADPLFVNSSSDFHLTAQSPCIDAATAYYTWQLQQFLAIPDSLYTGLAPDMGCFEYDGTAAGGSVVPAVTRLLGNYPNPFNPTTEIRFQISDASQLEHTQIEIFNVKGQKVRKLEMRKDKLEIRNEAWGSDPQPSQAGNVESNGTVSRSCHPELSRRTGSRSSVYSITWDGTDSTNKPVASGVYLYQLKVGNKTIDQRKMMLLK